MVKAMPDAQLVMIRNTGHCPHLIQPQACISAIESFLQRQGF